MTDDTKLLWFVYDQNGSGNTYLPPAQVVAVQAATDEEADQRMLDELEIDVWAGMGPHDCECCGCRWSPADEGRVDLEEAIRHEGILIERLKEKSGANCPDGPVPGLLVLRKDG